MADDNLCSTGEQKLLHGPHSLEPVVAIDDY